jgi:hypothetical protein
MFAVPAWLCYAAIVAAAVVAVTRDPGLVPRPQHVVFSDYRIIVLATIVIGQVPLVLMHELFHVLAARRLGILASVRVSHRFYFVVFETVLDGLAVVPRRRRYLPILAGMLADMLAIAGLTLAAAAFSESPLRGVCLALAFATLLRLGWQFCLFMRTDVYYLVAAAAGCVDLHTTARQLLANRVNAMLRRPSRIVDEAHWHPRDRRFAPWYVPLLILGYVGATVALLAIVAPLAWQVFGGAIEAVFIDGHRSPGQYWDSVAVLTANGVQIAAAAMIARRERHKRAESAG